MPSALLRVVPLLNQSFVLRGLQPVADKLDFDHLAHGS